MVRRKAARREAGRDDLGKDGSLGPSSSWTQGLERLPPPPQLPADGVSLIAPKWTRGRGNDHAEPSPAAPSTSPHRERASLARLSRYEILGRVHLGRDVSVFLARLVRPDAPLVALKLSRTALSAASAQESGPAQGSWSAALTAVAHPNLCSLIEITTYEAQSCVVHTWLEGVPLDRLLMRLTALGRPLPPHIAASVVAQVAAGIDHAEHMLATRGVPNSAGPTSILPNDIMLCPDGSAVLLDLRWRGPQDASGTTIRKSVSVLGELLSTLLTGGALARRSEPAPFSFRVSSTVPAELSEIVERTRPSHEHGFADALALSTALQHFVGYESNQEERQAIATFVDGQFPDAAAREPHIQTGPEVRRALSARRTSDRPVGVRTNSRSSSLLRSALWLAGGLLLVLGSYLLSAAP